MASRIVRRSVTALAVAFCCWSGGARAVDQARVDLYLHDVNGNLLQANGVDADGLPTIVYFRYVDDSGNPTLVPFIYRYQNVRSSCTNADASSTVVERYYTTILGRPSEAGGKAYWTSYAVGLCAGGLTPGQAFGQIAAAFFTSPEYVGQNKDTSAFVADQYVALLNRQPEADGLAYWTAAIDSYGLPRTAMMKYIIWTASEYAQLMAATFVDSAYYSPWFYVADNTIARVQP